MSNRKTDLENELNTADEILRKLISFGLATNDEVLNSIKQTNELLDLGFYLEREQVDCQQDVRSTKKNRKEAKTSNNENMPLILENAEKNLKIKQNHMIILSVTFVEQLKVVLALLKEKQAAIQIMINKPEIPQKHIGELTELEMNKKAGKMSAKENVEEAITLDTITKLTRQLNEALQSLTKLVEKPQTEDIQKLLTQHHGLIIELREAIRNLDLDTDDES